MKNLCRMFQNSDFVAGNNNNNTGIYKAPFPKVTKRLNMKQNKTYSEQNTLKQALMAMI